MASGVYLGVRVVRGPNWRSADDDGGAGAVGTVVELAAGAASDGAGSGGEDSASAVPTRAVVVWDAGKTGEYRCGADGQHDLSLLDPSPAGVQRRDAAHCSTCGAAILYCIQWTCRQCSDVQLCNKCYCECLHDIDHPFTAFAYDGAHGLPVQKRNGAYWLRCRGIYPSAKVCRGHNWQFGDEDGGEGSVGEVQAIEDVESSSGMSMAVVEWANGKQGRYRVGHAGKVDLKCVEPARGFYFYRDHLPALGRDGISSGSGDGTATPVPATAAAAVAASHSSPSLQPTASAAEQASVATGAAYSSSGLVVGNLVQVLDMELDIVKTMQKSLDAWDDSMVQIILHVGEVQSIEDNDTRVGVFFPGPGATYTCHSAALSKVGQFPEGSFVVVTSNKDSLMSMTNAVSRWDRQMELVMGKVGKVVRQPTANYVVEVAFGEQTLHIHPGCLRACDLAGIPTALPSFGSASRSTYPPGNGGAFQGGGSGSSKTSANGSHVVGPVHKKPVPRRMATSDDDSSTLSGGRRSRASAARGGTISETELDTRSSSSSLSRKHSGRRVSFLLPDQEEFLTELGKIILTGDVAAVRELLDKTDRATINCTVTDNRVTPMHVASVAGNPDILQLLHERGCDLELRDSKGYTPLLMAANDNVPQSIVSLHRLGADLNPFNLQGFSALHAACRGNCCESVRRLLDFGAEIDILDEVNDTPLHYAIAADNVEVVEMLVKAGASVDRVSSEGFNAVQQAAFKGATLAMRFLLSRDPAQIRYSKKDGYTPLHIAAVNNHIGVVLVLLEKPECVIDALTDWGLTALVIAAGRGNRACVEQLIAFGADVTLENTQGLTALHVAVEKFSLAESGANTGLEHRPETAGYSTNIQEIESSLTFAGADCKRMASIAVFLVQQGCDLAHKSYESKTVLDYCSNQRLKELLRQNCRPARMSSFHGSKRPERRPTGTAASVQHPAGRSASDSASAGPAAHTTHTTHATHATHATTRATADVPAVSPAPSGAAPAPSVAVPVRSVTAPDPVASPAPPVTPPAPVTAPAPSVTAPGPSVTAPAACTPVAASATAMASSAACESAAQAAGGVGSGSLVETAPGHSHSTHGDVSNSASASSRGHVTLPSPRREPSAGAPQGGEVSPVRCQSSPLPPPLAADVAHARSQPAASPPGGHALIEAEKERPTLAESTTPSAQAPLLSANPAALVLADGKPAAWGTPVLEEGSREELVRSASADPVAASPLHGSSATPEKSAALRQVSQVSPQATSNTATSGGDLQTAYPSAVSRKVSPLPAAKFISPSDSLKREGSIRGIACKFPEKKSPSTTPTPTGGAAPATVSSVSSGSTPIASVSPVVRSDSLPAKLSSTATSSPGVSESDSSSGTERQAPARSAATRRASPTASMATATAATPQRQSKKNSSTGKPRALGARFSRPPLTSGSSSQTTQTAQLSKLTDTAKPTPAPVTSGHPSTHTAARKSETEEPAAVMSSPVTHGNHVDSPHSLLDEGSAVAKVTVAPPLPTPSDGRVESVTPKPPDKKQPVAMAAVAMNDLSSPAPASLAAAPEPPLNQLSMKKPSGMADQTSSNHTSNQLGQAQRVGRQEEDAVAYNVPLLKEKKHPLAVIDNESVEMNTGGTTPTTSSSFTFPFGGRAPGIELAHAVKNGDYDLACSVLAQYPDCVNEVVTTDGRSCLHIAATVNRVDLIQLLHTHGAYVDHLDEKMLTPVHVAANGNCHQSLECLAKFGSDLNMFLEGQLTAMHLACRKGHAESVEVLLRHKVNMDVQSADGNTPLFSAITNEYPTIVRLLVEAGANVRLQNHMQWNALHHAAMQDCVDSLQIVLARDASLLNTQTLEGGTPLHIAARHNRYYSAKALLDMPGCRLNQNDLSGFSPLMLCTSRGHKACTELLVLHGAVLDCEDAAGNTPLHVVLANHSTASNISDGQSFEDGYETGPSPLINEIESKMTQSCERDNRVAAIACFLAEHGSDLQYLCHKGISPLDVSATYGLDVLLETYRLEGADRRDIHKKPQFSSGGKVGYIRGAVPNRGRGGSTSFSSSSSSSRHEPGQHWDGAAVSASSSYSAASSDELSSDAATSTTPSASRSELPLSYRKHGRTPAAQTRHPAAVAEQQPRPPSSTLDRLPGAVGDGAGPNATEPTSGRPADSSAWSTSVKPSSLDHSARASAQARADVQVSAAVHTRNGSGNGNGGGGSGLHRFASEPSRPVASTAGVVMANRSSSVPVQQRTVGGSPPGSGDAMHAASSHTRHGGGGSDGENNEDADAHQDGMCLTCYNRAVVVFKPCAHRITCLDCCLVLKCPECRRAVRERLSEDGSIEYIRGVNGKVQQVATGSAFPTQNTMQVPPGPALPSRWAMQVAPGPDLPTWDVAPAPSTSTVSVTHRSSIHHYAFSLDGVGSSGANLFRMTAKVHVGDGEKAFMDRLLTLLTSGFPRQGVFTSVYSRDDTAAGQYEGQDLDVNWSFPETDECVRLFLTSVIKLVPCAEGSGVAGVASFSDSAVFRNMLKSVCLVMAPFFARRDVSRDGVRAVCFLLSADTLPLLGRDEDTALAALDRVTQVTGSFTRTRGAVDETTARIVAELFAQLADLSSP